VWDEEGRVAASYQGERPVETVLGVIGRNRSRRVFLTTV
jgi:hypothetical protein